jgi:nucleoside-diphosphate-sugar epimerase
MDNSQKILVAGAGGTLGLALTRALAAAGHEVIGLTRSAAKLGTLRAAGATPHAVDALDTLAVRDLVLRTRPGQIVNLLTALPAGGALRPADLRPTNELRRVGSANLIAAALEAGVRRVLAESFVAVWGDVDSSRPLVEEDPLGAVDARDPLAEAIDAMRDLERQHLDAASRFGLSTVVLRYGLLYGPGVPSTESMIRSVRRGTLPSPRRVQGRASWLHIDDAIAATRAIVEHAGSTGVYHVSDDAPMTFAEAVDTMADALGARRPFTLPEMMLRWVAPVAASLTSKHLALDSARLRRELAWYPRFPSVREGFASLADAERSAA